MARKVVLLVVLMFCQIVEDLACLTYNNNKIVTYDPKKEVPWPLIGMAVKGGLPGNDPPESNVVANAHGKPDLCMQPPMRGGCYRYIDRWNYNATLGDCRRFSYSGCGGNDNTFKTRRRCLEICAPELKNNCEKPGEYVEYDQDYFFGVKTSTQMTTTRGRP